MSKDKKTIQLKKGYIIHETNNRFLLCKVLNEYNNKDDAKNNLIKLLSDNTTETELLTEYTAKESI